MSDGVDLVTIEAHPVHAAAEVRVVVVHHVAEKAVKEREAAVERFIGRLQSEMPLADDGGVVTGVRQRLRQQRRVVGQIAPAVADLLANHAGHTDEIRIAPGQERRARRRTDRRIRMKIREAHPLGGQPVDGGARQVRGAVRRQIAVTQVVDQDHQNVGRLGRHGVRHHPALADAVRDSVLGHTIIDAVRGDVRAHAVDTVPRGIRRNR